MTDNERLADLLFGSNGLTPEDCELRFPPRELPEGARVTRFSPSPTGYLHIGGLFGALVDFLTARVSGGLTYLRIEDTDKKREVADGVSAIINGFKNFGLEFDEGVTGFDDMVNGHIDVNTSEMDDQILIKTDGMPTYNFANVVDDHLMGITHVIRGSEYLSSTPKYNLLYQAFGWNIPNYIHCPPVMKDAQNKLSKRNGDASYQDLVAKGYLTEAILNYICLLGWSPKGEYAEQEIFSLADLVKIWTPDGISKSPAIFDPLKLRAINAEYIRRLSPEEFLAKAEPWIDSAVHTPINKKLLCANLQPRCEVLGEIPEQLDFFDAMPEYDVSLYANKKQKTTPESAKEALEALLPVLSDEALDFNDRDTVFDACKAKAEELGKKNGWLLYPLGIALSGKQRTPGGGTDLACMMGRETTLERVKAAIEKLNG